MDRWRLFTQYTLRGSEDSVIVRQKKVADGSVLDHANDGHRVLTGFFLGRTAWPGSTAGTKELYNIIQ